MKPPEKLEDLSKPQLIILFRNLYFRTPTQGHLARAVWEDMEDRAQAMMDDAIKQMNANSPCDTFAKHLAWDEGNARFDRAMKLGDEANTFFKTHVCPPDKAQVRNEGEVGG